MHFAGYNNKCVKSYKVNDALNEGEESHEASTDRQSMVIRIINEDLSKIKKLCKKHDQDMPIEMKRIYNARIGKFQAKYKYDLVHTNSDEKTSFDFADEWFEEIQNNIL